MSYKLSNGQDFLSACKNRVRITLVANADRRVFKILPGEGVKFARLGLVEIVNPPPLQGGSQNCSEGG